MHVHHIDLQTGRSERSLRCNTDPAIVSALRDSIDVGMTRRAQLPDASGYEMLSASYGSCLRVSLWREQVLLTVMGVSGHKRGGTLWRGLLAYGGLRGDPKRPPCGPWCAVNRVAPTMLSMSTWRSDLEQAIAWAWLDRLEAR